MKCVMTLHAIKYDLSKFNRVSFFKTIILYTKTRVYAGCNRVDKRIQFSEICELSNQFGCIDASVVYGTRQLYCYSFAEDRLSGKKIAI